MRPATPRLLEAITSSHEALTRVEVLHSGEVVLSAETVASGNVTLDQTAASRGRVDVTFIDDGSLGVTPIDASDALAPYGNEMRVSRGVRFPDGTEELIGLGVFRIDDVAIDDAGGTFTIQVAGMDRSAIVADARFEDPYQIAAGTNYAQAIQDTITLAVSDLTYLFATTDLLTPQLIAEEGSDRWAFCQSMAAAIGMTLYFNGDGHLVLRPVTAAGSTPVWTLAEGEHGLLLTGARRWTRQGSFNRVIATGENTGQPTPVRGVATDDNPTSPTYYEGPFGKVPRFYSSPLIITDDQASDAAHGILARELGTTQAIDFGSLVNPTLEPDDPIRITRPRAGINEIHVVDALVLPLAATDPMTGKTRATQVAQITA